MDERGRPFACKSLVVGGEYFIPSPPSKTASTETLPTSKVAASIPPTRGTNVGETPDFSGNPVGCNHHRKRLLRRIVVASGSVSPESLSGFKTGDGSTEGRGLFVLPPGLGSVGNPSAVHVVSLDESTAACPGGLDGACVLHLTTTMRMAKGEDEDGSEGVLGRAAKGLLTAAGVHEVGDLFWRSVAGCGVFWGGGCTHLLLALIV